ncbi:unnamed protein product [Schistosoma margrebowiei]|uniref:Uncharacterized protein n=1 Tax=Schistosoma margrebowiei TaxID=48269 RepID=A0A183LR84_9TREM|nr:unnamed protein product [Schistosoma margrebowiei]
MLVGGSRHETMDPGFVLLDTRQHDVILRELVLPGRTAINQSLVGICASCADCFKIAFSYKHYEQRWMVVSNEIKDAHFALFKTRQSDVLAS